MNELIERYKQLEDGFTTNVTIKQCLRVNTLRKANSLLKRLEKKRIILKKVLFLKHGYWYNADFSLGSTTEYLQGYYYLQEAASQIPVEVLNPSGDDSVLDMAAAPGSKTTQLAQYMNNQGMVVALDTNTKRLSSLANNLERCGANNCIAYRKDARFAFDLGKKFDKILLDAPCSGNFAMDEEFFEKHTIKTIRQISKTQKELLKSAVKCLKPKGTLVYSTCSLEPEENEMNINWLLNKYDDIELAAFETVGESGITKLFDTELNPEIIKCKRLWPHKTGTQGFFIARVRRI